MITQKLVERAKAAIKTSSDARYFFEQLTSPDWIVPLDEARFFEKPLESVKATKVSCSPHGQHLGTMCVRPLGRSVH